MTTLQMNLPNLNQENIVKIDQTDDQLTRLTDLKMSERENKILENLRN